MLLPKFDYHEPQTLEETCQIMAELGDKARPLAGGTDLIVNMKKGSLSPGHVVSLTRIDELKALESSKGRISIGACVTAAEIAESEKILKGAGALAGAAGELGSPLIRNLATVAGNIITARPAADLPPPLMAYEGEVILKSSGGERTVNLEDFFLGPGETVIKPDEVVTRINLKTGPENRGAAYLKLGVRNSLEISLVNVAAAIFLDDKGVISGARIFLGSVAPTPLRAESAEKTLLGEKPGSKSFSEAAKAAASDSRPIDDFRASAEYKKGMVETLTIRALSKAYDEVKSK